VRLRVRVVMHVLFLGDHLLLLLLHLEISAVGASLLLLLFQDLVVKSLAVVLDG